MDDSVNEPKLAPVLIALLQGVLNREDQPALWQVLLQLQARARDYFMQIGLELMLDEGEGFAYLRQHNAEEGEDELPRLVPRRQLSYPVSLLLALLRKKLAEHDATGGDARLILTREQIVDTLRLFILQTGDEVKLLNRCETYINKVVELGFLRKLKGQDNRYEVLRILAAFIDAQWLAEFSQRLAEYRDYADDEGE